MTPATLSAAELAQPLTAGEEQELHRLEHVVERGIDTFLEVGNALVEIQAGKLYRATHASFEAYLEDRFDGRLSRRRAYQLVAAAGVCTTVHSAGGIAPTSERQARELVGLSAEQAVEVMEVATASGTVTAATIKAARTAATTDFVFTSGAERRDVETIGECTEDEIEDVLRRARADDDLGRAHVADLARQIVAGRPGRRRRPLPEAYKANVYDLGKIVASLQRLHEDDRWPANRDTVALVNRGDLQRFVATLHDIVSDLAPGGARR